MSPERMADTACPVAAGKEDLMRVLKSLKLLGAGAPEGD
jgi:hypothetical protein